MILAVFYGAGMPKYVPTTAVNQVQVSSPAERMGLKPGDVVIAAQGKPVKDSQALRKVIATSPTVTLQVRRDGAVETLGPATPRKVGDQRLLGFVFDIRRDGTQHFGAVALGQARRRGGLAGHEGHRRGAQEPRLDRRSQQRARASSASCSSSRRPSGDGLYLEQLAWLSLSLALFNLLPFLPLDGGHILFALIERVRRKPLAREVYERVSMGGIAVFLVLFLLVLQQDVSRIIDSARPGP